MHTLSIPAAKTLLQSVAFDMLEPAMLWGQPGVGKSEMIRQLAEENGAALVDIRLSQYDSVDLRGIPTVDEGLTVWNVPSTLPFKGNHRFSEDAKVIVLFLDEINSASPAVAAVAYQLINDRRVGEHQLMDSVIIIAAGNRESDKGVTNKMPTPLANRFTHIEIGLDVDAACVHFQKIGLPEIGIAFLQFRKPLISTFIVDKQGTPTVTLDKAFATPRTWVKALKYYASSMPKDAKIAAMAGAVGDGPANEFWGFVDIYSKIKDLVPSILSNPEKADVPEERSLMYAVTVALSGQMDTKTTANIHKYLLRLDSEFVVLAWMLATKRDEALYGTPEFMDFSKKFKAVFSDK
jgi:hypothetical protein